MHAHTGSRCAYTYIYTYVYVCVFVYMYGMHVCMRACVHAFPRLEGVPPRDREQPDCWLGARF